jgi:hypothetical protein
MTFNDSYEIMASIRQAEANGEITKEEADKAVALEQKFLRTGSYD